MLLVTSGMFQILCPVYFTAVTNGIQSSNIGYTSHKVFAFAFPPVAQQDHGEYFSKNTHPYKPPPSFVYRNPRNVPGAAKPAEHRPLVPAE